MNMKTLKRAALALSFIFCLLAGSPAQTVYTASSTATTPANLAPGAYASVTLAPGPNTITVDIAGTYTGQFALMVAYQGTAGPLRTWPNAQIVNSATPSTPGIAANATGMWTATVQGPGRAYLVATSLSVGTPSAFFASGSGSNTTGLALESGNLSILASIINSPLSAGRALAAFLEGSESITSASQSASTTWATLTTNGGSALGTSRLGVHLANTGSSDVWVGTTSGSPRFLVPAGSDRFISVKGGVTLYYATLSGSSTVFATEYGF